MEMDVEYFKMGVVLKIMVYMEILFFFIVLVNLFKVKFYMKFNVEKFVSVLIVKLYCIIVYSCDL